jgi:hypothetical protein
LPQTEGEERTDMNNVVRWLAVLTLLLATAACMDTHLHCEVPVGGDVNVLGSQDNGYVLFCASI